MRDPEDVIHHAMQFPLDSVIQRYARDQKIDIGTAKEHERELRRFLALVGISQIKKERPYSMRGPIDELWHTLVTFTKVYQEFCDVVAGEFIHHFPNTTPPSRPRYVEGKGSTAEPDRRSALGEGYRRFLKRYEEVFGEPAPAHLWPRPVSGEMAEYSAAARAVVA